MIRPFINPDETWRFGQKLAACTEQSLALWRAPGHVPSWGVEIDRSEKIAREHELEQHIRDFKKLIVHQTPNPSPTWRDDLLRAARTAAANCLGLSNSALSPLFNNEALEATRQFVREARAFDPAISEADIMQAMRNVWVAHSIQVLAGLPLSLSPALFAYSMLYPWTDNCLDDAQLSRCQKMAFCDWLGARLQGSEAAPTNHHTEQVSRLVGLIERCFPRTAFPEVYLSLLAIHGAQMRSMSQQNFERAPDEEAILNITVAKGGTSVLVDACLLQGRLDGNTSAFAFQYGVCLQLLDDLQDLKTDLQNQHTTLFAAQTYVTPLDALTARLWLFLHRVLWPGDTFISPPIRQLRSLIWANCRLLLLQAVAKNQEFFTPLFVQKLEAVSPLSFSYLAEREKGLTKEYARLIPTLGCRARTGSLITLLEEPSPPRTRHRVKRTPSKHISTV